MARSNEQPKDSSTFLRREDIQPPKPPVTSLEELAIPRSRRKKQDTLATLERDAKKSLGNNEFADAQWKVMLSYINSTSEKESRRVTAAQSSTFGTIDDLFHLIDKEVNSEFKGWDLDTEGDEEWD